MSTNNVTAYPFTKPAETGWPNGGGKEEEIPVCSQCGERRTSCENCTNEGEQIMAKKISKSYIKENSGVKPDSSKKTPKKKGATRRKTNNRKGTY